MSTYSIKRGHYEVEGCIDLVESEDNGGWYAQEYDFTRKDSATRTSKKIYSSMRGLTRSLDDGSHEWQSWS